MKLFYQSCSKKSGIYKIINTHTNRIYIGQCKSFQQRWYDHKRHLLDGRHQNKFLLNDYNKCKQELGDDDFLEFHVLEVMENSTKEERNLKEEFYITSVFDKQELCYNFQETTRAKEASCWSATPEETKDKLSKISKQMWINASESQKNIWLSNLKKGQLPEAIKKRSEKLKGRTIAEETKIKISKANKGNISLKQNKSYEELYGKFKSEKIKKTMSESTKGRTAWNKGLKMSEEQRKKLSIAHQGIKLSDEHKEKISKSLKDGKAPWVGKQLSEEHRRKLSEAHKGQIPWQKKEKLNS